MNALKWTAGITYWQKEVNHIHQTEDDIGHLCLMIAIAGKQEHAGYDVMGEHLGMVFPSLFDVDNHDLLQPETKLDQNIPFQDTNDLSVRPIPPHHFDVKPVIRIIHNVLETG
jgi:hypothetical protein